MTNRRLTAIAAITLILALYLSHLTTMGMVSKDEPRYADIGRAMARSGDWITPRLFGQPWFEKPALLYWMIGLGFSLHLGIDLAPRLPVALLSLCFLAFFWFRVRSWWDAQVATYSTVILATTAGWLAYSHVAVTDLPLAALFSAAVLFALSTETRYAIPLAAAALALATLTKSLVPLVLFVPVLAVNYRTLLDWLRPMPVLIFAAICAPWYWLCWMRNGGEFIDVLFIQQQFSRFHSPSLQHVQPVWFYIPVVLMLLFPWFPLLALVRYEAADQRAKTLIAVVVFGFIFFSASLNKLPSYVLPLLPSFCILMGLGLSRATDSRRLVALAVVLLAALPAAAGALPAALAGGIRTASIGYGTLAVCLVGGVLTASVVLAIFRKDAFGPVALLAAAAFFWFEAATFPAIDAAASARPVWRKDHPVCVASHERGLIYGLDYYAERALPPCPVDPAASQIVR